MDILHYSKQERRFYGNIRLISYAIAMRVGLVNPESRDTFTFNLLYQLYHAHCMNP